MDVVVLLSLEVVVLLSLEVVVLLSMDVVVLVPADVEARLLLCRDVDGVLLVEVLKEDVVPGALDGAMLDADEPVAVDVLDIPLDGLATDTGPDVPWVLTVAMHTPLLPQVIAVPAQSASDSHGFRHSPSAQTKSAAQSLLLSHEKGRSRTPHPGNNPNATTSRIASRVFMRVMLLPSIPACYKAIENLVGDVGKNPSCHPWMPLAKPASPFCGWVHQIMERARDVTA